MLIVISNLSTKTNWIRESSLRIGYSKLMTRKLASVLPILSAHQRSNHTCMATSSRSNFTPPRDLLQILNPTPNTVIVLSQSAWLPRLNRVSEQRRSNLKSTKVWLRDCVVLKRGRKRLKGSGKKGWVMVVEMAESQAKTQRIGRPCCLILGSGIFGRTPISKSMKRVESLRCSTLRLRITM